MDLGIRLINTNIANKIPIFVALSMITYIIESVCFIPS
jgi:hypothetical protein